MPAFTERISAGEVLLSDGAMGTLLHEMGGYSVCPEELNLSRPDVLEEIARLYVEAGSDIVHTNTFGASPLKLGAADLQEYLVEINQIAVEAARQGAGKQALVSASIGPTGKLMLMDETTPEEIEAGYVHQIGILVEAGVDLICIETMTDLLEILLAVRAAKQVAPDIPCMAQMTFDPVPQGFRTIMGISIEEAVPQLLSEGALVVGSNCGHSLITMVEVAQAFREVTDAPLIIQSNAGLPELIDGSIVHPESAEMFAEHIPDLLEAGVAIIGGCCGTTPDHIRAMRSVIDSRS